LALELSLFNQLFVLSNPCLLSCIIALSCVCGVIIADFLKLLSHSAGSNNFLAVTFSVGLTLLSLFIILPTLEIGEVFIISLFALLLFSFLVWLEYNFLANHHLKLSLFKPLLNKTHQTAPVGPHKIQDIIAVCISHNQKMFKFSFLETVSFNHFSRV
jgi:hypothetical protein